MIGRVLKRERAQFSAGEDRDAATLLGFGVPQLLLSTHAGVVADRLAHRFAHLDVVAPALRRVDLVGAPAGRAVATRLLDNGALGIVMPHVDTADEAREVGQKLKYPPIGHRSMRFSVSSRMTCS